MTPLKPPKVRTWKTLPMSDEPGTVELYVCGSMVELAALRALFEHRNIPFNVVETPEGEYRVIVSLADRPRATEALRERGFGDDEEDRGEDAEDDAVRFMSHDGWRGRPATSFITRILSRVWRGRS